MSARLSRCVAVYGRHFVASRINAPAVVVAVVFTLDHFVTTQTTMGWTKSLLDQWIPFTTPPMMPAAQPLQQQLSAHHNVLDRST